VNLITFNKNRSGPGPARAAACGGFDRMLALQVSALMRFERDSIDVKPRNSAD